MTATFLLIRHAAHVEYGRVLSGRRPNVALSQEGLAQAAVLADLLGTAPVKAVYTSPRERAWYTAREIAEPHELAVIMEPALDEIDFRLLIAILLGAAVAVSALGSGISLRRFLRV